MKVGIIGAGLIGRKRAASLGNNKLVQVANRREERGKELANEYNCDYTPYWKDVVENKEIDIIIVCTTNESLTPISIEALKNGKHVLVEKPVGRNPEEVKQLVKAVEASDRKVSVGFNHRFHPAMMKAKEILDSGAIGDLMYIRGIYGHGGRLGYDKEWRANPEIAGGGEMLDQGSHLIDLSRWYAGDFQEVTGFTDTMFWDMLLEDNGFVILRNKKGNLAFLHASWSEWKNRFSYKIFGKTGLLEITGIGGSYGEEKLIYYKMKPEMGPPNKKVFEFPKEDKSWDLEFQDLLSAIEEDREPIGNIHDAYETIKLVYKLYDWSEKHRKIK